MKKKIKIYVCLSGFWDKHIELITTDLDKAFEYADNSLKLIDVREYEATIENIHQFIRPERPNKE